MSKFDDEYIAELYEKTQTLTQRLHDAEADAAFAYKLRDEEAAALTAERDKLTAELNRTWEMYVGAATAQGEAEHREDVAEQVIADLTIQKQQLVKGWVEENEIFAADVRRLQARIAELEETKIDLHEVIENQQAQIANLETMVQTIAELRKALEDVVEYVEPCDKDEGRDYCMTHHEFQCPAAVYVITARALLFPTPADAAHEEETP